MNISKTAISIAIASILTGCNGGGSGSSSDSSSTNNSNTEPTPAARIVVPVDSAFTAMFRTSIDHNTSIEEQRERKSRTVSYFEGTLTATNITTGDSQSFDWPVTVNENGQVTSEKTVTIEPGNYNFNLVVSKGSQQYTAILNDQLIEDEGEYRLNMDISPIVGDTIVNIDEITTLSRLKLEFPPEELGAIAAPQIGLIIDGVEHIYQINTATGMADIVLNLEEGVHTYDVNLYNGNNLIARSKIGQQSVDLVQGDDLIIELISLQADITVDFSDLPNPRFVFNIPEEVVEHIGDVNNLQLLARITDGEQVQEAILNIQQEDGRYFAEHIFEETENNDITAYIEFLDITSGTAETISSCADSITVFDVNTMSCGIELTKDYVIGGNLLATLSINVLNSSGVAQDNAEVYINSNLVGVTGNNFATSGFIKTHVKAGELHTATARKDNLSDTYTITPTALSINNFDLILSSENTDTAGGPSVSDPGDSNCLTVEVGEPCILDGDDVFYAGRGDNGLRLYFDDTNESGTYSQADENTVPVALSRTDGLSNTIALASAYQGHAANVCVNKGPGWYLPSVNESQIALQALGGIVAAQIMYVTDGRPYVSSTELDNTMGSMWSPWWSTERQIEKHDPIYLLRCMKSTN